MKDIFKLEKNQWIPREISYSLKATSRKNKNGDAITSKENAILAVVIPDINNSYSYYINDKTCCDSNCREYSNYMLFNILSDNMFNIKNPEKKECDYKSEIYYGNSSYIEVVKWDDFINDTEKYVARAYNLQENIDDYNITKELI